MDRSGRKLKTGLAALALLGTATIASETLKPAKDAKEKSATSEAPKSAESAEEKAVKWNWHGAMDVRVEKKIETDDHKTVYYFEGDRAPEEEDDDAPPAHMIGITITDQGDPKVVGDEKRYDFSLTSESGGSYTFTNETPAGVFSRGELLAGPFGKVEYVLKGMVDGTFYGEMIPKDDLNKNLAELNGRYWTYYGLKQADKLDSAMGEYATENITSVIERIDELIEPAHPDPKLEELRGKLTRLVESK